MPDFELAREKLNAIRSRAAALQSRGITAGDRIVEAVDSLDRAIANVEIVQNTANSMNVAAAQALAALEDDPDPDPDPDPEPTGIEAAGAFAGWSAANINTWTPGTRVAVSFVAEHTGRLDRFYIHLRLAGAHCDGSSSGYGAGNGGTARFEFYEADEGGLPTGPMLFADEFQACARAGGDQQNTYANADFDTVKGTRYVAVISNIDPNPSANHFSVNVGQMHGGETLYDGKLTPEGERVRRSGDGGQTYDELGWYGTMFPTYHLIYADGIATGHRARGLWGSTEPTSGSTRYDYLAGKTITALGAYGASGGTTNLTLRINGSEVASASLSGAAREFLRYDLDEPIDVPEGASVEVAWSGSLPIYRMGTHYPWLGRLGLADSYLYSYSAYPFYLIA